MFKPIHIVSPPFKNGAGQQGNRPALWSMEQRARCLGRSGFRQTVPLPLEPHSGAFQSHSAIYEDFYQILSSFEYEKFINKQIKLTNAMNIRNIITIGGNGNPLQYSYLENPRDKGAWWAAVYGVAQSRTWLTRLSSSSRIYMDLMT